MATLVQADCSGTINADAESNPTKTPAPASRLRSANETKTASSTRSESPTLLPIDQLDVSTLGNTRRCYSILTMLEIRAGHEPGYLSQVFKSEAAAAIAAVSGPNEASTTDLGRDCESPEVDEDLGDVVDASPTPEESGLAVASTASSHTTLVPHATLSSGENPSATAQQAETLSLATHNRRRRRRKERKIMRVAVRLTISIRRARCAWMLGDSALAAISEILGTVVLGEKPGRKATPRIVRAARGLATLFEANSEVDQISDVFSLTTSNTASTRTTASKREKEKLGNQWKYELTLMTVISESFPMWLFVPRLYHITPQRANQSYQLAAHEIYTCYGGTRLASHIARPNVEILEKKPNTACTEVKQHAELDVVSSAKPAQILTTVTTTTATELSQTAQLNSQPLRSTPAHMMGSITSLHFTGLEVDVSENTRPQYFLTNNWMTPASNISARQTMDSPPALLGLYTGQSRPTSSYLNTAGDAPLSTARQVTGDMPSTTVWQLALSDERDQFGTHSRLTSTMATPLMTSKSGADMICSSECAMLGATMCTKAQNEVNRLETLVRLLRIECEDLRKERDALRMECRALRRQRGGDGANTASGLQAIADSPLVVPMSAGPGPTPAPTPVLGPLGSSKLTVSLPPSPSRSSFRSSPLALSLGPTASGADPELGLARVLKKRPKQKRDQDVTQISEESPSDEVGLVSRSQSGRNKVGAEQEDDDVAEEDSDDSSDETDEIVLATATTKTSFIDLGLGFWDTAPISPETRRLIKSEQAQQAKLGHRTSQTPVATKSRRIHRYDASAPAGISQVLGNAFGLGLNDTVSSSSCTNSVSSTAPPDDEVFELTAGHYQGAIELAAGSSMRLSLDTTTSSSGSSGTPTFLNAETSTVQRGTTSRSLDSTPMITTSLATSASALLSLPLDWLSGRTNDGNWWNLW